MNVMVDIESDGPCPGMHSMICFGAVIVEPGFNRTFYGQLAPISEIYVPEALAISGFTREQTLTFPDPHETMSNFATWLKDNVTGRPIFWADNNGYDFSFINYYFWQELGRNPFGWSSQNLNSFYKGVSKNLRAKFNFLKDTRHTHHPVDDAKGNAEALLKILNSINIDYR